MPRKAAGNLLTARIAVAPETLELVKLIAFSRQINQDQVVQILARYILENSVPEKIEREFRKAQEQKNGRVKT